MASQTKKFKVVVVGSAGVGKTTFNKRNRTGEFQQKYYHTMGVEVHPLEFRTNKGKITINTWDCAGKEEFKGLGTDYYKNADAAIIMFDVFSLDSYNEVKSFHDDLTKENKIPIVVCGNKVDKPHRIVK